jgi:hypothetical protein
MICGVAFGLVIAPIGFALLHFTYIPLLGKLLGLIGLLSNLIHGSVGYFCLVGSGVISTGVSLTATQFILVNLVNALLFSYFYGTVGYLLDQAEAKRSLVRKVIFP